MPAGTVKSWVQKLRRRALWLVVAVGAVSVGVIVSTALPAIAVIAPAAITVLIALNSMTAKITESTCLGCGADVSQQPVGARGRICPECGAVNERLAMSFINDELAEGGHAAATQESPASADAPTNASSAASKDA